ncbi:unnamed protein product [Litomosoides sigmodontis]|uniref:Homeobox domain-containing protein n=1 Tax=Litomosoides sigmodontis TaxID=42156 RepID=A0A3P6SH62_LITSI|nr:unnamed protein product [Litomosoides sigmodontis]
MNDFEMFGADVDRIPFLIGRMQLSNLSLVAIPSNYYSSIAQFASPYQLKSKILSYHNCYGCYCCWCWCWWYGGDSGGSDESSGDNYGVECLIHVASVQTEDDGPETSERSYSEGEGTGDGKNGNAADDGNAGKNGRVRRNRTSFSSEQLEILEAAFNANTYPDQDERERIAMETSLSEEKIMARDSSYPSF